MAQEPASELKIALAQLNPVVGDLDGNAAMARAARAEAQRLGADLIVLSELFLTGYPPEDLVLKPAFRQAARRTAELLAKDTADGGPAILIGSVWEDDGQTYNAVLLMEEGRISAARYKVDLPNYGVFDEKRVFAAGPMPGPIAFKGVRIGVPICEDIWQPDVVECLEETGAELLIVPNGSPYSDGKHDTRMQIAVARVTESGLPLAYVNQVGGQDELVFEGASFVLNADRSLAVQMPAWEDSIRLTIWRRESDRWRCERGERALIEEGDLSAYLGCVVGLRDYVRKNGFPGVVLGLSGGIDSAIVAAMAADALGPERVHALMLPYKYTSSDSLVDAAQCAEALGIRYDVVSIHEPVDGFMSALEPLFAGTPSGTAEENVQSRVRGTLLMAVSNKFGSMLVTTGNKSEVSVGYATLYGDMNGGFNPIKDLYKMEVYRLAALRNTILPKGGLGPAGVVIPERILTKAPTAELKPNQKDQDTLPPYEVLDDILECLVEHEMPIAEIVRRGHPLEVVRRVERMLNIAEYKRRQAAPGVKISSRNFGRDRRYPITNKFRDTSG
ncbi:MAG: NAD+ synthase [Hyphomicrobiaceae bacterium]